MSASHQNVTQQGNRPRESNVLFYKEMHTSHTDIAMRVLFEMIGM